MGGLYLKKCVGQKWWIVSCGVSGYCGMACVSYILGIEVYIQLCLVCRNTGTGRWSHMCSGQW